MAFGERAFRPSSCIHRKVFVDYIIFMAVSQVGPNLAEMLRNSSKLAICGFFFINFGQFSDVLRLDIICRFRQDVLISFHEERVFAESDEARLKTKIIVLGLFLRTSK